MPPNLFIIDDSTEIKVMEKLLQQNVHAAHSALSEQYQASNNIKVSDVSEIW
jgi:hypothetical protein